MKYYVITVQTSEKSMSLRRIAGKEATVDTRLLMLNFI